MLRLYLYARVHFCLRKSHAGPRVQRAPGLPCALRFQEGNRRCKTRAKDVARRRSRINSSLREAGCPVCAGEYSFLRETPLAHHNLQLQCAYRAKARSIRHHDVLIWNSNRGARFGTLFFWSAGDCSGDDLFSTQEEPTDRLDSRSRTKDKVRDGEEIAWVNFLAR
jgi:hypothetical protein